MVRNTAAKIIEQLRCIGEVLWVVIDLRLRGDFVEGNTPVPFSAEIKMVSPAASNSGFNRW
jgi:hypothetical protein